MALRVCRYIAGLPKARLVRHPTQRGSLRSRMDALASASTATDTLVFLDHNVVVSKGWLEPLLDLLAKEPRVIAVPHYDQIPDPVTVICCWRSAIRPPASLSPFIPGFAVACSCTQIVQ